MRSYYFPKSIKIDDRPVCYREIKPGVDRNNHKLTDHIDYNEEKETKRTKKQTRNRSTFS